MDPHQFTRPPQTNLERHLLLQSISTVPKSFLTTKELTHYAERKAKIEKLIFRGLLAISQIQQSITTDETEKTQEETKIRFLKQQICLCQHQLQAIKVLKSANKAIQITQNWNGDQDFNNRI